MIGIFWFRRDLRLEDNIALYQALSSNASVLPIFIFDENILDKLEKNDARVSFIYDLLIKIQENLNKQGKSLAIFHGNPLTIFKKLITENNISAVFANRDYEPNARERDKEIYYFLEKNNIAFKTFKDQVIFEKSEIIKDNGTPYQVFTPYSKRWIEHAKKVTFDIHPSIDFEHFTNHNYPFLSIQDIGFEKSTTEVKPFVFSEKLILGYEDTRNIPSLDATSYLSPHLRFGSVSIRFLVQKAIQFENRGFLNELIWREFFMQILWHFPHTVDKSFKPVYDNIIWKNDEAKFVKWCEGKTGYPMVDAGMRQLNATGYMHNRVRMIVASFLCKHLLIDWRWGEAYFAQKLLDFELSSNVGNWQWAAGSGVDAAPYFRIFNPSEQQKKFDPKESYIKKWIPEYGTAYYLKPIVDHKTARDLCLETYKKALK
jgi:deoxyribodipyrimidine photo-lyase